MHSIYWPLVYTHLFTILPCIPLGLYILLAKKGSKNHRFLGKIYLSLMFFSVLVSLFIPAHVGPQLFAHFGWIHILSFMVLYTVVTSLKAIKKGDIKGHQRGLVSMYIGGLIIAGGFTLFPGRYLYQVIFG